MTSFLTTSRVNYVLVNDLISSASEHAQSQHKDDDGERDESWPGLIFKQISRTVPIHSVKTIAHHFVLSIDDCPIFDFELPLSCLLPFVFVRITAVFLHSTVIASVSRVTLVLRKQILYFRSTLCKGVSAKNRFAKTRVSIQAALTRPFKSRSISRRNSRPDCSVVPVNAALRVVGRVTLVGTFNFFSIKKDFVHLSAIRFLRADREGHSKLTILSVVL